MINLVILTHAQPRIFTAQKVADAALSDGDTLGLARGATGVNHISRVRGQSALTATWHSICGQLCQQLHLGQDLRRNTGLRLYLLRFMLCNQ